MFVMERLNELYNQLDDLEILWADIDDEDGAALVKLESKRNIILNEINRLEEAE